MEYNIKENQSGGIYRKLAARGMLGWLLICLTLEQQTSISLCWARFKLPSNTACKMPEDTLVLYNIYSFVMTMAGS